MLYESAVVLKGEVDDVFVNSLKEEFRGVLGEYNGELVFEDDWGVKNFPQPTKSGITRGRYMYLMFRADAGCNKEIKRRLGLKENVLKSLVIKLGSEKGLDKHLTAYKKLNLGANS